MPDEGREKDREAWRTGLVDSCPVAAEIYIPPRAFVSVPFINDEIKVKLSAW